VQLDGLKEAYLFTPSQPLCELNVTSGVLEKFSEYDGFVLHIEAI
jgi:hypothetical protein